MTIASYSELVSEIGNFLNRTDLGDRIPTFIRLFESRANRLLRSPQMELAFSQTTTADEDTYSLPSDFLEARELYLQTDPVTVLEPMSQANLRKFYPDSSTGQPRAYAIVGQNIILAPIPDGSYVLTLGYYQAIPALTVSDTTNWLLDTYPDAYLWGSLTMAEAYVVNDERAALWKSAWDETFGEIMAASNAQRAPAGPLTLRPTVIE